MATSALVWDEVEKHFFETGVSQVALAVYNSESKTYGTLLHGMVLLAFPNLRKALILTRSMLTTLST